MKWIIFLIKYQFCRPLDSAAGAVAPLALSLKMGYFEMPVLRQSCK
jgi:hypothetical protein